LFPDGTKKKKKEKKKKNDNVSRRATSTVEVVSFSHKKTMRSTVLLIHGDRYLSSNVFFRLVAVRLLA
jgi:hypothetical protein